MHFSKHLAEVLLALPPELSGNAIEYHKLKKLIHGVVDELESLGLSPAVLQQVLRKEPSLASPSGVEVMDVEQSTSSVVDAGAQDTPRIVYELSSGPDEIKPRLRLHVPHTAVAAPVSPQPPPQSRGSLSSESDQSEDADTTVSGDKERDKPGAFVSPVLFNRSGALLYAIQSGDDVLVPLPNDEEFYRILSNALQSLEQLFGSVHDNFVAALRTLSQDVSNVARPLSSTSSFHPHSHTSDPASIRTSLFFQSPSLKSDLSVWREIFQLYVEAEIFENLSERAHGERSIQDAEARLKMFSDRVASRGLGDRHTLRHKDSRAALASFLRLNLLLMNIKKFQFYNSEALRKILKKHAKRTALPPPLLSDTREVDRATLVVPIVLHTLPRTLVQAIGEVLLPIIPHIDDYSCAICTSIAFKPIRLSCRHLFCVRCLVKMQKRGQDNCPMCRALTVSIADRSNVDWALLNFLQDWFPEEAYEKLRANEREAAEEQMEELGIESGTCVIC
ncbi:SPX domain-containing protein [Vararia minispora EC-137]|uniref:SPX domain-containing protein n=1 Tax=Vararia minispora EC-137 TaxID=1314806 RepID=A0ACB8QF23_9AGAM|nr:SPX domain-containing protein [Vararia minispora EC-137]